MNLDYARYVDRWLGMALCLVFFVFDRTIGRAFGRRLPALLATTPPQDDAASPAPRRILCTKFYGLGNMIMLLPVLAGVKRRHPEAELHFLTLAGNEALLDRSGVVDRVLTIEVGTVPRFLVTLVRTLRTVMGTGYDTFLDFEQFVKVSTVIGFLSGARERIGFNTDGQRRGFLYTKRVVYTDSDHMTGIFARLARVLDVPAPLPEPTLPTTQAEQRAVTQFLGAHGVALDHAPLVAVHLGTGKNFYRIPVKRWPPERFAAVADGLAERYGAVVVFTGQGKEERRLVAEARAAMKHPSLDGCDRFGVLELAALLARCHFAVANDTSAMHLAACMGTPVVALFGPTAPLHYGPRGPLHLVFYQDLYCSPCLTNYNLKVSRCLDPVCMRMNTPEAVLAAIDAEYLGPRARHRAWILGRPRPEAAA
jgi:heptosyltransferase-1